MQKLLACVIVLCAMCSAQQKKTACDNDMTFCWYSDQVIAQGNRWVSQDGKKTLEVAVTFRCVKSLNLCVRSRSYHQVLHENLIVTSIELMPVASWDNEQITANAETFDWEPCDRDSYVISRADRTVLLISSPGPKAETPACTGILGPPRTITYRLSQ